ncbi:heme lyase NrfEFG subunit NrfF [Seminibacterium arietis]|uniref:Formate-dependent nitrite reductase complex subunit n=1 Tax=Seminibacterium arietis TaxID=1173502 RepID=A0ABW3IA90_9PAST
MQRFIILIFTLFSLLCHAEIVDTYQFNSAQNRIRAVDLAKSLRCPQCQNQNLVESNSPIASDLRIEVYKMVDEGKTNEEIIDIMVTRFGDFVRYNPPLKATTIILWILPLILFIIGIMSLFYYVKDNKKLNQNNENAQYLLYKNLQFSKSSITKNKVNLLFLILILLPFIYYFSLDRFELVQNAKSKFFDDKQRFEQMKINNENDSYIIKLQNKLRENPNDDKKWFELAEVHMQNNEFDYALIAYKNVAKIVGFNAEIAGKIATSLYYKNKQNINTEIKQYIDFALNSDSNEVASLSLLASDAFLKQDYNEAIKLWQKILDSGKSSINRRAIVESMKMAESLQNNFKN